MLPTKHFKYCTIFKTTNNELAIFGKTLTDVRNKLIDFTTIYEQYGLKGENGAISSLFKTKSETTIFTPELEAEFSTFQELFNNSSKSAEVLAEELGGVSDSIIDYAKKCKNGELTNEGFKKSLEGMSFSAKAGKIALQGLAMAGNMIAMWAIAKVIEGVGQAIDNYVNAWEHATEAIEEHSSAYENAKSEIETVSSKIGDLDLQIAELNGLDPIANADDIEKLELERKILEAQLELLKEKRDLEQEEANKAAENYFNTTSKSKVNVNTVSTPETTGDVSLDAGAAFGTFLYNQVSGERVTPEEELQLAIDKIKEYKQEIDKLDSKEDAQEIADLEAKIVALQTDANTLATTMLKNSGSLTDETQKGKIIGLVTEYNNLTDSVKVYTDTINKNTSAQQENVNITGISKSREEMISSINGLSEGFEELDKIYSSIQDKNPFDFKLLDDKNFKENFSGLESYADFIETISENNNDINSCKTAFNTLVTEWIKSKKVLEGLTAENENVVVQMLEQMGITNALELTTNRLAVEQEFLAEKSKNVADATIDEVNEFLMLEKVSDQAKESIARLKLSQIDFSNFEVKTQKDVNNILAIAKAAGTSEAYIKALENALVSLQNKSTGLKAASRKDRFSQTYLGAEDNVVNNKQTAQGIVDNILKQFDLDSMYEQVNYGGGSKSNSSSGSKSEKIFDWIETRISRLQRTITNFGKTVSATYLSWTTRNDALLSQLSAVNEEIIAQQKAYETYLSLANSVPLDETYKSLVRNGGFSIDSISDENLKKKIELYTEYYDKALSASDALQDLEANLAELTRQQFDNIAAEHDATINTLTSQIDKVDSYIDQVETRGYIVSASYYEKLKVLENENASALQNKYNSLSEMLKKAVDSGRIKEGSEEYHNMMSEITSVEQALIDSNTALIEYSNTIRDLNWQAFDKMQDSISEVTEEADFLIDLMSDEKMYNNGITEFGKATMGLHAVNYNTYMAQADAYAKELLAINKEIANDPNNQTLLERRNELLELQRDNILAAEDEKQNIFDLIREGYDELLESMDKVIEKRKNMMSQVKDLYDYEKTISEQTKAVSDIEKQLIAHGGDTSEAGKLAIQQLKVQLEEAKNALEETEYEKYISDQEKMLDAFRNETELWINERMDNEELLLQQVIDSTNENANAIKSTLEAETMAVGITLTDKMDSIWSTGGTFTTVVAEYGKIGETISKTLLDIKTSLDSMLNPSGSSVTLGSPEGIVSGVSSSTGSTITTPSAPTTPVQDVTTAPAPSNSAWGSWFIPKKNSVPLSKLNTETSIVDRLKARGFDSSTSARASYYAAMGGSGRYVGSASQNRWMIEEMKKHAGFAQGGTVGSLIRATGEDGFILARTGEEILSLEKIKELGFTFEKMNPIVDYMKNLPTPTVSNKSTDINVNVGDIQMYGVNDPKQFAVQLKDAISNDSSIRKIMNDVTLGDALGRNSLNRYKR